MRRSSASDDVRASPPGAGAAPGGQNREPRAAPGRGKRDRRSPQFYAHLNQIHFITPSALGTRGPVHGIRARIIAEGKFRGLARWLTSADAARQPPRGPEPGRQGAGIDAGGEDPREGDDGLGALLAAIADDVQFRATAARNGLMADFAGRAAHARKHLSRHLLAATLATIKEQRKAALAAISQNAALELQSRKKAAIAAWRGLHTPSGKKKPGRNPPGAGPDPH